LILLRLFFKAKKLDETNDAILIQQQKKTDFNVGKLIKANKSNSADGCSS